MIFSLKHAASRNSLLIGQLLTSPLMQTDHGVSTEIELALGTIDEKFLLGERDAEDKPLGAHGIALANLEGDHFYIRNEIPGVTDKVAASGTRFWEGSKKGPMAKASD
jgi:surfactin synthase thioesterase subunit